MSTTMIVKSARELGIRPDPHDPLSIIFENRSAFSHGLRKLAEALASEKMTGPALIVSPAEMLLLIDKGISLSVSGKISAETIRTLLLDLGYDLPETFLSDDPRDDPVPDPTLDITVSDRMKKTPSNQPGNNLEEIRRAGGIQQQLVRPAIEKIAGSVDTDISDPGLQLGKKQINTVDENANPNFSAEASKTANEREIAGYDDDYDGVDQKPESPAPKSLG